MKSDHAAYLRSVAGKSWTAAQTVEGWRIKAVDTMLDTFPDQEAVAAWRNLRDSNVVAGLSKIIDKRQQDDERRGQHDDDPTEPGKPPESFVKGTKH